MKNTFIVLIGLSILVWGLSLFISYVSQVASSFKPANREDTFQAETLQKEQRDAAQKAELQHKKFMEDYKFKLEQYKRSQPISPKF